MSTDPKHHWHSRSRKDKQVHKHHPPRCDPAAIRPNENGKQSKLKQAEQPSHERIYY